MKNILKFFGLFIALSVIFSMFSACSSTTEPQKGSIGEKTTAENPSNAGENTTSGGKSSNFPPVPSAIQNAEIRKVDGSTFKVSDLKGKVVLLNLWATWCGPCRQEMPHLVAMQNELKSKDFMVVGLNVDEESTDEIVPFAEKMKLNYDLAWADEKLMREFIRISKEDGIPQSFLIDREGHLRGVFHGINSEIIKKLRAEVEKVANE
ncbi:MAG TPA: TlpA disulfide reductase family protein [Pyrinomonadaceae bacterium]|jgi:cytochrome c biogenesis protein CcmG/thiol:disulfide interchange protein DsbE